MEVDPSRPGTGKSSFSIQFNKDWYLSNEIINRDFNHTYSVDQYSLCSDLKTKEVFIMVGEEEDDYRVTGIDQKLINELLEFVK